LPGVTRITAIDAIVTHSATHQISALATYNAAGSGEAHLLAATDSGLYDIEVSGGSAARLITTDTCLFPSVTRDGRWLACYDGNQLGLVLFPLSTDSSTAGQTASPNLVLTRSYAGPSPGSASWAPDGRHIAVALAYDGGTRRNTIGIYATNDRYDSVQLVARFTFVSFDVTEVTWSPDGAWLAIGGSSNGVRETEVLLPLTQVLPHIPEIGAPASQITIPSTMLTPLQGDMGGCTTWGPKPGMMTCRATGDSIGEWQIGTAHVATLLTQHSARNCALSWMPGGQRLAFVLCRPTSTDFIAPPAQLYLYMTPA
jgi:WD40 repeat protein